MTMMKRAIAMVVAVCLISFFPYQMGLPFPSSYLPVFFFINGLCALWSVFNQLVVIAFYEYRIHDHKDTFFQTVLKFVLWPGMILNHHVQLVLCRLPFIVNKALGILYALVLFILSMLVSFVFEV
ncbi:hypothetical protein [Rossellomorea marisflavi]|uniref:hypothetical protein n=1 Tax=Rossellomorea marisflavi TaxID=189381 RepID=UPI0012E7BBB8|nr:hypothetical protein [Rossellomorea marisflavi]QHA38125.1 hypothetical protein D5E69_21650 [Rossellomorea marisflavi]